MKQSVNFRIFDILRIELQFDDCFLIEMIAQYSATGCYLLKGIANGDKLIIIVNL